VRRTQRRLHEAIVSLIHGKSCPAIVVKRFSDARTSVARLSTRIFRTRTRCWPAGSNRSCTPDRGRTLPSTAGGFAKALWFSFPVFGYIRTVVGTDQRARMNVALSDHAHRRGRSPVVTLHLRNRLQRLPTRFRGLLRRGNLTLIGLDGFLREYQIVAGHNAWCRRGSPVRPQPNGDAACRQIAMSHYDALRRLTTGDEVSMKRGFAIVLAAVAATALFAALVHGVLVAAHLSEPAGTTVYGLTPRRVWAAAVAALAVVGVAIGGLALARPVNRSGIASGRIGATLALVAGLIAALNGGLNLAVANGGPGTGNGVVGGAAAFVLGLIATGIGGLAMARSRRTALDAGRMT